MAGSKVTKKEETKVTVKPKVVDKKSIDLSKLKDFKNKNGFNEDVKDKELEWIPISKAFTEATGLAGIPKGYITLSRGFSNTGKSDRKSVV